MSVSKTNGRRVSDLDVGHQVSGVGQGVPQRVTDAEVIRVQHHPVPGLGALLHLIEFHRHEHGFGRHRRIVQGGLRDFQLRPYVTVPGTLVRDDIYVAAGQNVNTSSDYRVGCHRGLSSGFRWNKIEKKKETKKKKKKLALVIDRRGESPAFIPSSDCIFNERMIFIFFFFSYRKRARYRRPVKRSCFLCEYALCETALLTRHNRFRVRNIRMNFKFF